MLSPEEEHQYTSIIDAILATADLETVTRKKIRQGLEQALGGKDLSAQKVEIKALIESRFDAIRTEPAVAIPTPPSASAVSEDTKPHITPKREYSSITKYEDDEEANGEIQVSFAQPPAKKIKRESIAAEDADARLAAELQAQENRLARGRTTRGGGTAKPKKKKAPKKKSAARVKDEGSDAESSDLSGTPKEKRKAGGGFQKPFNLSTPLADLCGEPQMSRPQVVKRLWEHIKGNDLQDPSNKRNIICDDMMQAVFKQTTVNMFTMNKMLGDHLYPVDE